MRLPNQAAMLLCAVLIPLFCLADDPASGAIRGKFIIAGEDSVNPAELGNILAFVEPVTAPPACAPKTYRIQMLGKRFEPSRLTVRAGDTVEFLNKESFRHNVFSLSAGNSFDLGTISRNESPGITFKQPGLVKVYCNIHREMAAYVYVTSAGYPLSTDAGGAFHGENLPPGSYELSAWDPRFEAKQTLLVRGGEQDVPDIILRRKIDEEADHLNKAGAPYPTAVFDADSY